MIGALTNSDSLLAQGKIVLPVCRVLQGEYEVQYSKTTPYESKAKIGVSTAYNNKKHPIQSVWHPIPDQEGRIVDLQSWEMGQRLPERFMIGDGALTRSFMIIDQSAGTKLDAILNLFTSILPGVESGKVLNEEILMKFLQRSMDMLVQYRWRQGIDGRGENLWDPKDFKVSDKSQETFRASAQLKPGEGFYATEQDFSVVPFENFLESRCAAYCIQKSLLTKLLLDRLDVPSKLVTGSTVALTEEGMKAAGHTWIEVQSKGGKTLVLDPEQELMGEKGPVNEYEPDWFWFNGYNRRLNQYFPMLVY